MFAVFFIYLDHLNEKVLMILLYMNLAFFLFTSLTRPLRNKKDNDHLMYADFMILMVTDVLVLFSSYCNNESARYFVGGWFYIGLIVVFVTFSLIIIIY